MKRKNKDRFDNIVVIIFGLIIATLLALTLIEIIFNINL